MEKKTKIIVIGILVVVVGVLIFLSTAGNRFFTAKAQKNINSGDFIQAKKNLYLALTFSKKNPVTYAYLGRIALGTSSKDPENYYPEANYQEAITHYEKAFLNGIAKIANKPLYKQTLEASALSYWQTGDFDKSEEKYLEEINNFPQNSFWARYFIGVHYFERKNKPQEGFEILKEAPNSFDNVDSFLYHIYSLLSKYALFFENVDNAENYAKLALENAPKENKSIDVQIAHLILAAVYRERGDIKSAEKEITTANALANSPSTHNCFLSFAYFRNKLYNRAIETAKVRESTVSYPYSVCLATLSKAYFALKNQAEAKKYYREYLALTDALKDKNIFMIRDRERIQKELQKP